MGSWSVLRLGPLALDWEKENIDPRLWSLFTENERVTTDGASSSDDESPTLTYRLRADQLVDRLELQGFGLTDTARQFDAQLARRQSKQEPSDAHLQGGFTFDRWVHDIARCVARYQSADDASRFGDGSHWLTWGMTELSAAGELVGEVAGIPFPTQIDARFFVRAMLATLPTDSEVVFDCSQLIGVHDLQASDISVTMFADDPIWGPFAEKRPLILLTEGSTDTYILESTVALRFPHLREYVTFPDFERSNAEGGADRVVQTVRAFAAAKIQNRTVALLDNDAAATDALRALKPSDLPPTIRVVRLPELSFARRYPTLGPDGRSELDVNGRAVSLEFFVGRDILQETNGHLPLVQWTGYKNRVQLHQGELLQKSAIQERYRAFAKQATHDPGLVAAHDWSSMEVLWHAIIHAFD